MSNESALESRLFSSADLKRLILPLVFEQILAVTIGMADTIMVASVGEAAVAGISLVDSINVLLIQIFSALATGGAVIASQYIGKREHHNACIAAKQLVYSTAAISLILMAVALIFRKLLIKLVFGTIEADVEGYANTYFLITALSYPFLALFNAGAALFRSMGNSRVTLYISIIMNSVNIIGNAITIYLLNMDVAGAALSTLISRVIGAVIILLLLRNNGNIIYIEKLFKPEFHWQMNKNILKIGIPNGLENGMFQVGKLLVQGIVATLGTAAIAANSAGGIIASFSNIPGAAIGLALITVVGQCVGAKEYEQAKYYIKKLMIIIYVTMISINVLIFIFAPTLVSFFDFSAEASEMAVVVICMFAVVSSFLWPMAFAFPNGMRAAGDSQFTMLVSILSMGIFRIGCCFVFVKYLNLGLNGVWLAMFADWVGRSAAFIIRYKSGKWQNIKTV